MLRDRVRTLNAHQALKRGAGSPSASWVPLALAWAIAACGAEKDVTAPDAAGGAGGAVGSSEGGLDGVGGACPQSTADAAAPIYDATVLDAVAADRLAPPIFDAPDDATCQLPMPAPVTCYVPNSPPPATPVARCPRSPRQVGGAPTFVSEMQVHGDTLYWTEQGRLLRNDGMKTEFVPIPASGGGYEIDGDSVYFVSGDQDAGFRRSILRWRLDGTGLTTIAPDISIGIFAMDEERIYFNTADGQFMSVAKSGCGTMEPVAAPQSVAQIMGLRQALIDETHFYWDEVVNGELAIKRVVKGTANVETVAEHLPPASVLLLQGDGILLVANGHLLEVPKSGGCPRFLGNATPAGIAADDRDIYWDAEIWDAEVGQARAVYRMPRTGGMAIEIVAPESQVGNGRLDFRLSPSRVFYARELYQVPSFRIMAVDR
jgi:hypothetical protein